MYRILSASIAALVILSACGGAGSGTAASSPTPTASPAPTASPSPAPVFGVADTSLGKVLVASNGATLYIFKKDTDKTSNCYDACATTWPPYVVTSAATGMGGKIATSARKDGTLQLTYNNQPLYFYNKDAKPGDTTGQGVGSIWFVVQNP
jgi:predicted lipoprotein with Yx(FWY)xxD motif